MHPGTYTICRTCWYLDTALAAQGHPAPCNRQYWVNAKLVKPTVDETHCDAFEEKHVRIRFQNYDTATPVWPTGGVFPTFGSLSADTP